MEENIQRMRQIRDFDGYIDLYYLAFEFSKLSPSMANIIKTDINDQHHWVSVLTTDTFYHPMITILSLGAYVGGTTPFVNSLTEALRNIEEYQKLRELGALQPRESDGHIDTSNLDNETHQLIALGALGPTDLSGASQLSKNNVHNIVEACVNKVSPDKWDQLINGMCQQLSVSRGIVSSNSLYRAVWMQWILQYFPDSKILLINCCSDVWYMVVLAHEVMGMAVRVLDLNGKLLASFGQTPEQILIRVSLEESMAVVDQAPSYFA